MILSRGFPTNFGELVSLVRESTPTPASVTIQAGHFLLYYDTVEDRILPCISSELDAPRHERLRREVGGFPAQTFRLGLNLLEAIGAPQNYLMVVVNDWQYIPKQVDRQRFYKARPNLPTEFRHLLETAPGPPTLLRAEKSAKTGPFHGEMNLRNQYRKVVERMIASGTLPAGVGLESRGEDLVCNLTDAMGSRREVYCSNKTGDCAAEIAQMLRIARQKTACDLFINLYPAVCRSFVEAGTELGEDLLGNGIPTVINVGMPTHQVESPEDLLSECEATLHTWKSRR